MTSVNQSYAGHDADPPCRIVGRGHLLDLGVSPSLVARWLRGGILRRTAHRGFYEITISAFEGLRSPQTEPQRSTQAVAAEPGATGPQMDPLRIVACTITKARAFVAVHHRHLAPPVSGLFAIGVASGRKLVGVAIVGRPVARALQDGNTAEVSRVCTTGARNACSKLLGACRRVAVALGYSRLITYTLASEPGASLRAAGWREVAAVRGRSWNCPSRPRQASAHPDKRRWEAELPGCTPLTVDDTAADVRVSAAA